LAGSLGFVAVPCRRPVVDITSQTATDSDSVFHPLPASDGVHILAAPRLNALCSDRADQSVVHLYNPFHPAILRCLNQVYALLRPIGKPITVCGEMAADPPSAAVLLGLGFTSLSVNLGAYYRIKRMIRSVSMGQLRELAAQILKMQKPREVEEKVRATVYRS
jgi:signal transduction protein with GAF and PtsI domain